VRGKKTLVSNLDTSQVKYFQLAKKHPQLGFFYG
jgi:hypothetical protein